MSTGTLHEGKPWREVVYIEAATGPKGGPYWILTLSCGHTAFRRKWDPSPTKLVSRMLPPLIHMQKRLRGPQMTAPNRVRCYHCPPTSCPPVG